MRKLLPIYIKDYDYPLPDDMIAKYPLVNRSSSRLLVYKNGNIQHKKFGDIVSELPANTLLIMNDTQVIKARVKFQKSSGSTVEVLLLRPANTGDAEELLKNSGESVWECMVGNKKKWRENETLELGNHEDGISAAWEDREKNKVIIRTKMILSLALEKWGELPIPPYLNRRAELSDEKSYQTTYSKHKGSVAAPTAGLHFTDEILDRLIGLGLKREFITLHVGAGTFKPVSADNVLDHEMHEEFVTIQEDVIKKILDHQGPVIPVGTTSMRCIESLYWFGVGLETGELEDFSIPQFFPYQTNTTLSLEKSLQNVLDWMKKKGISAVQGNTSIFILPGYSFSICGGIITNFHQPQSTLLLLISALVGEDWKKIYQEALEEGYRFLSYGDSSLLIP